MPKIIRERVFDLSHALSSLYPDSPWELIGVEYSGLNWRDLNIEKPTQEELETEVQRLQAEWDSKKYQRQRMAEYPNVEDQLDKIYHDGVDAWKADIQAIKDKYPKPTE